MGCPSWGRLPCGLIYEVISLGTTYIGIIPLTVSVNINGGWADLERVKQMADNSKPHIRVTCYGSRAGHPQRPEYLQNHTKYPCAESHPSLCDFTVEEKTSRQEGYKSDAKLAGRALLKRAGDYLHRREEH